MRAWIPGAISGDFKYKQTTQVGLTGQQTILKADPRRVAILWGQPNSIPYWVSPFNPVAQSNGFEVLNNALPLLMRFQDLGPVITQDWFAVSNGAATGFMVMEVLYEPYVSNPEWNKEE